MYTKQPHDDDNCSRMYDILDLDGDVICTVQNEWQADALLSHLNRSL